jgi:hypothetical protein
VARYHFTVTVAVTVKYHQTFPNWPRKRSGQLGHNTTSISALVQRGFQSAFRPGLRPTHSLKLECKLHVGTVATTRVAMFIRILYILSDSQPTKRPDCPSPLPCCCPPAACPPPPALPAALQL